MEYGSVDDKGEVPWGAFCLFMSPRGWPIEFLMGLWYALTHVNGKFLEHSFLFYVSLGVCEGHNMTSVPVRA